ncbi:hypothetical protein BASA81_016555 [Batrachochytrium salamandrivorans]|nr:hypothetical protein BASA81_016555 [Batrachochytrium salamandrivorans]
MRKLEGHISATAKPGRNAQALVFTPAKRAPEELITGNNREDLDPEENRVRNCVGCGFIYTQHRLVGSTPDMLKSRMMM